jgi:hypothetical protein
MDSLGSPGRGARRLPDCFDPRQRDGSRRERAVDLSRLASSGLFVAAGCFAVVARRGDGWRRVTRHPNEAEAGE